MVDGLTFNFKFYDCNGRHVIPKLGEHIRMQFFRPEELGGLGPEYSGDVLRLMNAEYAAGVTNAMSTPNIGLAQSWFDRCLKKCDCRDEVRPRERILPTRLIEIRTDGDTSSNTIARLREAKDLSADASYLTLSHCWGGNTIFKLTKGNLEILKRDIPVHQLPDLFKDVLYMTSQLGVKYIWIDCLCILQDCRDDWAYEAARMGDVYRYAQCNIAASGYKDSKTRLLKERALILLLNFSLYLDRVLVVDDAMHGYDMGRPFKGIYVRADDREFYNATTKGPLNSRGWVAQERALSPAILHFTPKQMWWECKNHTTSESLPYIDRPWGLDRSYEGCELRSLSAESSIREVYTSWTGFVSFYAGTDLTHESDRLPALAGISRAFGALTKDNLVAGFWEENLIQSLAWKVNPADRAKEIASTQLAPSWSWAYLHTPHEPAYLDLGFIMTLGICRRILSDYPSFRSDIQYTSLQKSAVRGLEITGPLRKLPVRLQESSDLSDLSEWRNSSVNMFYEYYDLADPSFFSEEDIADQAWHWEGTRILPLITEDRGPVSCLLLNRAFGAEHPNTFRRVGVVLIYEYFLFEDRGLHDLILI